MLLWMWGMIGGAIGGAASTVLASLGLAGAHSAGVEVPTLNLKAIGIVFLSGFVINGIMYIAKSPIPAITFDDSDPQAFTKDKDGNVTTKQP
jgi:hypothetical protein